MRVSNLLFFILIGYASNVFSENNQNPKFSDFSVNVSSGPFVKKIDFTESQKKFSKNWKALIERELAKPVNFSGHYRLVLSKDGVLPKECGVSGWVCGWIIDKMTGGVVSSLPQFNGNTKYYSTIDNGTPSPDDFSIEYYPNSSMVWISGQNIPENGDVKTIKCANAAYEYIDKDFKLLVSSRCEIDVGDDKDADKYLP